MRNHLAVVYSLRYEEKVCAARESKTRHKLTAVMTITSPLWLWSLSVVSGRSGRHDKLKKLCKHRRKKMTSEIFTFET